MAVGDDVVQLLADVLNDAGFGGLAREGRRLAVDGDDNAADALARDFLDLVEGHLVHDALCLHELTTDAGLHPEGPRPVGFVEPELLGAGDGDIPIEPVVVRPLEAEEIERLYAAAAQIREAIGRLRELVAETTDESPDGDY